ESCFVGFQSYFETQPAVSRGSVFVRERVFRNGELLEEPARMAKVWQELVNDGVPGSAWRSSMSTESVDQITWLSRLQSITPYPSLSGYRGCVCLAERRDRVSPSSLK